TAPASSVVTSLVGGAVRSEVVADSSRGHAVRVDRADDDLPTLVRLVADATVDGGCGLVVRNTVRRAQDAFDALVPLLGEDVVLLHSRFLAADRKAVEARLVRELGAPRPGRTRPRRLVVVATQVVEQSLDVDFDLLITDLAPT